MSEPDFREAATGNVRPFSKLARTPGSSEWFIQEKGFEVWLEEGRPYEWRCDFCEGRTGFDMVGHPPGRHLPQAFTGPGPREGGESSERRP